MSTAVYLRVSTGQQSVDQQHDVIAAAGVTPDRVFTDTASGRAGSNRPGWTECMGWLREGDHLVVVAVDRLGRSVREVATALYELTTRGIHVRSLREGVDTSTPTGRAVTSIMASIAELELELGKERRAASREARVARGLAATKPMKLDAAHASIRRYSAFFGFERVAKALKTTNTDCLAIYGSLMNGLTGPDAPDLSGLTLVGPCRISGYLVDLGDYPGLLRSTASGDETVGELYKVDDRGALKVIDQFERYDPEDQKGSLYVRRLVRLLEPRLDAWTYIFNRTIDGRERVPGGNWRTHVQARGTQETTEHGGA